MELFELSLPRIIFITGLAPHIDTNLLNTEFKRFGSLDYVKLFEHPANPKQHLGMATICFATPSAAQEAAKTMNSKIIFGK